jgi:hypothetical protein
VRTVLDPPGEFHWSLAGVHQEILSGRMQLWGQRVPKYGGITEVRFHDRSTCLRLIAHSAGKSCSWGGTEGHYSIQITGDIYEQLSLESNKNAVPGLMIWRLKGVA